jgi:hypothetical protein
MENKRRHYLYVISGVRDGNLELKIGHTWNFKLRLSQHKRYSGRLEISVLKQWSTDEETARAVERKIHKHLKKFSILAKNGRATEWYPYNSEVCSSIGELGVSL